MLPWQAFGMDTCLRTHNHSRRVNGLKPTQQPIQSCGMVYKTVAAHLPRCLLAQISASKKSLHNGMSANTYCITLRTPRPSPISKSP